MKEQEVAPHIQQPEQEPQGEAQDIQMESWLEPQVTGQDILPEQEQELELVQEQEQELEQDQQDMEQHLVFELVEELQSTEQEPDQIWNQGKQKSGEQPTGGRHSFQRSSPHHLYDRIAEQVDKQPGHNDQSWMHCPQSV